MKTLVIVAGIEQPPFSFKQNGASLVERNQRVYFEQAGHVVYTVRPGYPEVLPGIQEIHLPSFKVPQAENFRTAIPRVSQKKMEGWLREKRPDLIYLHGPYEIAVILATAANKLEIPYILHVHTDISGYVESRVPTPLWPVAKWFALDRALKLANGAALTIFPSECYRLKFVAETGFSGRSKIFPSYIEPFELLTLEERDKLNMSFRKDHLPIDMDRYPAIIVMGRLENEKNPKEALLGFVELNKLLCSKDEMPVKGIVHPVLIFIGGGTKQCKQELEQISIDHGVSERVYFAGARENEEARRLLQTGKLSWFLSHTDTQGFVAFEAAYAGLPVFGLKGQPFWEFFGNDFLAVPKNSPQILALRSRHLLARPKLWREKSRLCIEVAVNYSETWRYRRDLLSMCQSVVSGCVLECVA